MADGDLSFKVERFDNKQTEAQAEESQLQSL